MVSLGGRQGFTVRAILLGGIGRIPRDGLLADLDTRDRSSGRVASTT
jgi:hypothetical protein